MDHLITVWRVVKQGLTNFLRNTWLSTAATAVMLVTLTIMLGSVIINLALSKEIDNIVKDITVSVYFKEGATENQRTGLNQDLLKQPNVRKVKYISKDEALRIFSEENKEQPELLDGLTIAKNALPASFEVQVLDLGNINPIVKLAESKKYENFVEETSYDKNREERIQRIASTQRFITTSSAIAGGVFATISILIILNTIRMAIFTRGEEIRIMQLIGATNAFIRGPFLFEAALYGIVASVISLVLVYSALFTLSQEINQYIDFSTVMIFFTGQWYVVVGGTLFIGVGIGVLSSLLAMTRYLKL